MKRITYITKQCLFKECKIYLTFEHLKMKFVILTKTELHVIIVTDLEKASRNSVPI